MTVGKYNLSPPTLADGGQSQIQLDSAGNLKVVGGASGASSDQVQGNIAHDAVDAGNPLGIGGNAVTSQGVAVAAGDRVRATFTPKGALHVSMGTPVNAGLSGGSLAAFPEGDDSFYPVAVVISAWDGAAMQTVRGDTNGIAVAPGLSSTFWTYSNGASGILSNTTAAVTIKTAAGASVRNYIDSITINTTAFGASVPIAIRDGAGGTVLWSANVPTAGFLQPVNICFAVPLRSTANTLIEVVTTTANTTGTVWFSAQGHTGA